LERKIDEAFEQADFAPNTECKAMANTTIKCDFRGCTATGTPEIWSDRSAGWSLYSFKNSSNDFVFCRVHTRQFKAVWGDDYLDAVDLFKWASSGGRKDLEAVSSR
jgi:hypothetical protein